MDSGAKGWARRSSLLAVLLGAMLGVPACDGTLNDDVLDMEGSLRVASSDGSGMLAAEVDGLDAADLRARLAEENVTPRMSDWHGWESLTFEGITVVLPEAAGEGPDLIESITLYQTRPDEPDVKIASIGQVPRGATLIALSVEDVDLTDGVLEGDSKVRVEVHGPGAAAAQDLTVEASLRVDWPDDASCRPSNHF